MNRRVTVEIAEDGVRVETDRPAEPSTLANVVLPSVPIAHAPIRAAFNGDPEYRMGWVVNICMLIYDDQRAGIEGRSHEPPTNLQTLEGCRSIAERITDRLFK